MAVYIALWRGINVGGKNMIKMAELRRLLEIMGLTRVQTYINSGNAVFESEEAAELLSRRIEDEVSKLFGVSSNVMMRTAEELEQIVSRCPYSVDAQSNRKKYSRGRDGRGACAEAARHPFGRHRPYG